MSRRALGAVGTARARLPLSRIVETARRKRRQWRLPFADVQTPDALQRSTDCCILRARGRSEGVDRMNGAFVAQAVWRALKAARRPR